MDLFTEPAFRAEALESWKKIEFCQTFVREAAIPLLMGFSAMVTYLRPLDTFPCMTTSECFNFVLSTVFAVYDMVLNIDELDVLDGQFICSITQERFLDPVMTVDGFNYERYAIQDWFEAGKRTSPKTGLVLSRLDLVPNHKLKQKIDSMINADVRKVLEFFVFDIIFADSNDRNAIPVKLLDELTLFASGRTPHHSKSSSGSTGLNFSQSSVINLLRELLKIRESSFADVDTFLTRELHEATVAFGSLDSPLGMAYLTVIEEQLVHSRVDYSDIRYDVKSIINIRPGQVSSRAALDSIAHIRFLLNDFANRLCGAVPCSLQDPQFQAISERVTLLLENEAPGSMGRSMRMYLLKLLERNQGVSFLRNALSASPLLETKWLQHWRQSEDVGLIRFIGSNKLPKSNPFMAFPLFREMQDAVTHFLKSENLASFEGAVQAAMALNYKHARSALMLAFFHEISLLSVLPADMTRDVRSRAFSLQTWAKTTDSLGFSKGNNDERNIFVFYAFGQFCNDIQIKDSPLLLHEDSPPEAVLKSRVSVHVAACALCVEKDHPFAFFKTLLLSPLQCKESFFPTMPEDELKMAQRALGGRWYSCANGHPFYVDKCGGVTEVLQCNECGLPIGGRDHQLQHGKHLDEMGDELYKVTVLDDKSEKDYCLRSAAQESQNRLFSARACSAQCIRVIRVFLHSICLSGMVNESWRQTADPVFLKKFCGDGFDMQTFLCDHLTSDWQMLKGLLSKSVDDVAMLLHLVLLSATVSVHSQDCFKAPDSTVRRVPPPESFAQLPTLAAREAWEYSVGETHIMRYLGMSDLSAVFEMAETRFGGNSDDGEGGLFSIELLEKVSIESIPKSERCLLVPGLWLFNKRFSFEHFKDTLNLLPGSSERYPVLSFLLSQDQQLLNALSKMPEMFDWFKLLHNRFNKQIGRNDRKMNAEVISEVADERLRLRWQQAFMGFADCWNNSWSRVGRFGCILFSKEYSDMKMDLGQNITFSLPNPLDEGNCPLALVAYLNEQHNQLAHLIDEVILKRNNKIVVEDSNDGERAIRVPMVSSKFFTSVHAVKCDVHEQVVPLLEKYCLLPNGKGYDFAKAENIIIDRFFAGIHAINLEQPGFTFAHEQHIEGGFAPLRNRLAQKSLTTDTVNAIKRDVNTPATAQHFVDLVETVVSLLNGTGGNLSLDNLGETLLSVYVKNVLQITEKLASVAIEQQVRLNQLESLWGFLSEIANTDIFASVLPKYKRDLSLSSQQSLQEAYKHAAFSSNVEKLYENLKLWILHHLLENVMNENLTLINSFGYSSIEGNDLMDIPWFRDFFPADIKLSEAVAVYTYFSSMSISNEE